MKLKDYLVEADMRKMFNCVFGKALDGDKGVLKSINLQGRLSDQNIEDAMEDISDKDIKTIYKKYC